MSAELCGAHEGIKPAANGCIACAIITFWDKQYNEVADDAEKYEGQAAVLRARVEALEAALEGLRMLPNHIDPPAPCWCGWQADIKHHSFICQQARAALLAASS